MPEDSGTKGLLFQSSSSHPAFLNPQKVNITGGDHKVPSPTYKNKTRLTFQHHPPTSRTVIRLLFGLQPLLILNSDYDTNPIFRAGKELLNLKTWKMLPHSLKKFEGCSGSIRLYCAEDIYQVLSVKNILKTVS